MDLLGMLFNDLRSPSQKLEDSARYDAKMYPFGKAQEEEAKLVLNGVPGKIRNEVAVFLYLIAKQNFIARHELGDTTEQSAEKALRAMRKVHMTREKNIAFIFSLAMLDLNLESMEYYPHFEEVHALEQKLFPDGLNHPNWEALPQWEKETV